MSSSTPVFFRSYKHFLAGVLLSSALVLSVLAETPHSLLPAFGTDGNDFTVKAKDSHIVKGWLPKGWSDNTDWAPVTATYTKLTDTPDKGVGAVEIKVESVEEGGQLQLTTYEGTQKFKKGMKYVVSGWARAISGPALIVGIRQTTEPYEFYHEQEISPGVDWKRFEFTFTPAMDIEALTMFVVREPGTVDLAGVTLEEAK